MYQSELLDTMNTTSTKLEDRGLQFDYLVPRPLVARQVSATAWHSQKGSDKNP